MGFSKHTTIGSILREYPEAAEIVGKYMKNCLGCGGADKEPIFHGAQVHGVDAEQVLRELNALHSAKKE